MINRIRAYLTDWRIGRQYRKAVLAQLDRADAEDMRWKSRPAEEKS